MKKQCFTQNNVIVLITRRNELLLDVDSIWIFNILIGLRLEVINSLVR